MSSELSSQKNGRGLFVACDYSRLSSLTKRPKRRGTRRAGLYSQAILFAKVKRENYGGGGDGRRRLLFPPPTPSACCSS